MKLFKIWNASLLAIAVCALTGTAQAGVIYTSEAAFDAAVLGFAPAWSEDFEGFPLGPVPDPLPIAGGAAEMFAGSFAEIAPGLVSGNAWLKPGASPGLATIQGPFFSPLGVNALSFNFGNEAPGSWVFVTSLGLDVSAVALPSPPITAAFVGWIGGVGEYLDFVHFSASGGVIVDNVRAFTGEVIDPVPTPGALALLGLGLLGIGVFRRRQGS